MDDERRSYTLEEARALVPSIRAILLQLAVEQRRLNAAINELRERVGSEGAPGDRSGVERGEAAIAEIGEGMQVLLTHLEQLGVELRDVEAGLVDIPTDRDGEPAWYCWRLADPELAYWHSTREGFAGRKPV